VVSDCSRLRGSERTCFERQPSALARPRGLRPAARWRRRRPAFTLIEILVVVAIIALLIAILIPSLNLARDSARASVCGNNIRQLISGGNMWLTEVKRKTVPAHQGWAPYVLKGLSWETEPFHCPSDKDSIAIAPIFISQHRPGYEYPTLATDSGYFRRNPQIDLSTGAYTADMETEADVSGGDTDFDDCTVYTRPDGPLSATGKVWARKRSTGRRLDLHSARGKTLVRDFGSSGTPEFDTPVLWGSYGMNLSVVLVNAKPWNLIYLDYTDWSAVVETSFHVEDTKGRDRGDMPGSESWVALRHHGRANVGFLDTHVERLVESDLIPPEDESAASIWHPRRDPGWQPPQLK
jgi:prepilin-type N-terminal cleavage/methylation domain-containing protein/prepilin-type processing-associated H-X9-DG protein